MAVFLECDSTGKEFFIDRPEKPCGQSPEEAIAIAEKEIKEWGRKIEEAKVNREIWVTIDRKEPSSHAKSAIANYNRDIEASQNLKDIFEKVLTTNKKLAAEGKSGFYCEKDCPEENKVSFKENGITTGHMHCTKSFKEGEICKECFTKPDGTVNNVEAGMIRDGKIIRMRPK